MGLHPNEKWGCSLNENHDRVSWRRREEVGERRMGGEAAAAESVPSPASHRHTGVWWWWWWSSSTGQQRDTHTLTRGERRVSLQDPGRDLSSAPHPVSATQLAPLLAHLISPGKRSISRAGGDRQRGAERSHR